MQNVKNSHIVKCIDLAVIEAEGLKAELSREPLSPSGFLWLVFRISHVSRLRCLGLQILLWSLFSHEALLRKIFQLFGLFTST